MTIPGLFKEYIWLIETINRYGKITFAELNELWKRKEESAGVEFSRTTFNRHRDTILDMFGLIIECDRRDGYRYYIENHAVAGCKCSRPAALPKRYSSSIKKPSTATRKASMSEVTFRYHNYITMAWILLYCLYA